MTPNQLPPLSDEQFPDFLTDTDVARIFRHVYGGQQFDSTERMFSAEVEAAVRAKFREALAAIAQQAQEPVAWLYVDTVGERYLCFSRPTGGGAITNLYTTPPAPQPAPVDEEIIAGVLFDFIGWLTSREKRIVLSSADFASPAVEAIREFAQMRGLDISKAAVRDWQARAALQSPAPQTKAQP